ncbi:MAG: dGTP triphosphohydrolase [Candidatus Hydrogenedentota bacterium]
MKWPQLLNKERIRPSTNPGDHRDEFERDYDRAIFSTPVKRLQDKAQVFPLEPHDAIRTRLTHSLEVSSVARGLAIAVAKWLAAEEEIDPGVDRQIEAIAATCGLIHDLGNPPFGHAGEDSIREWFVKCFGVQKLRSVFAEKEQLVQDFLKFEGNAQTLRLVTKLQILADYTGLNLTFATLSASRKYTAQSDESGGAENQATKKPGHFASENEIVERIQDATGTGRSRHPLAYIAESADDIVYSVADIEDAIKKGILSWRTVKEMLEVRAPDSLTDILNLKDRILQGKSDLDDDIHGSAFRTASIAFMVRAATEVFKHRYRTIMEGTYKGELVSDDSNGSKDFIVALKQIGRQKVYCTPPTLKLELMGRRVITDLMTLFWEGAEALPIGSEPRTSDFPGRLGALLSRNYRNVFAQWSSQDKSLPETYYRLQLVTDYVCGMTDSFAKRLHAELTNG